MIVRKFEVLESTNLTAKEEAAKGAENGTVILADMQTAGRGRRGREWNSPPGKNLYFSLLLRPDISPDRASMLTLVMALAVAKAMEKVTASTVGIKWPNDIVLNGKKVCGILTEMGMKQSAIDYVIVGVGVNVCRQEFPSELADMAADLETLCGQKIERQVLLEQILNCFETYYAMFVCQGDLCDLQKEYNQLLVNREREVCVLDPHGEYRGVAKGITPRGELCVRLPDGSETNVYAGEVSVRGIYGYV